MKKGYCLKCAKKMKFTKKIRLKNFPFIKALSCEKCGEMFYY